MAQIKKWLKQVKTTNCIKIVNCIELKKITWDTDKYKSIDFLLNPICILLLHCCIVILLLSCTCMMYIQRNKV